MLRLLICSILILFFAGCTAKRSPAPIDNLEKPGPEGLENLEILGKVWGYAKYHHPVFKDGECDVDQELFQLIPAVVGQQRPQRNRVLFEWLNGLGDFLIDTAYYMDKMAQINVSCSADLSWINHTDVLGDSLCRLLRELQYAKRTRNHYAKRSMNSGKVDFSHEKNYGNHPNYSTQMQLLALFRLWNMAEYYFPSVTLTDKKWQDVLREHIPRFIGEKTEREYRIAISRLIGELNDAHAGMTPNPLFPCRSYQLPLKLKFLDDKLIVTDVFETPSGMLHDPLQPGDEIVRIDGKEASHFLRISAQNVSASNAGGIHRHAALLAEKSEQSQVVVSVRNKDDTLSWNLRTIPEKEKNKYSSNKTKDTGSYYYLLTDSIGYMDGSRIKEKDGRTILHAFKQTKAIVIDMRRYPRSFFVYNFTGKYLIGRRTHFATFIKPIENMPGYFKESPRYLGEDHQPHYPGRIVVLVNEETISSGEFQTMGLQACPRTIVVGSQTAGADGDVILCPLPGKIITYLSGFGVYYPDGTNTQRTGLRIDHYVEPTVEGIKQGRDEILETALHIINHSL